MKRGPWGLRVDTSKFGEYACNINWTPGPLPMVSANLAPSGHIGPLMWTPEEAWEIGHAIVTAAANAMEGVTAEESAR